MVWYSEVWFGLVYGIWYGMVWYGMVWYGVASTGGIVYGMVYILFATASIVTSNTPSTKAHACIRTITIEREAPKSR